MIDPPAHPPRLRPAWPGSGTPEVPRAITCTACSHCCQLRSGQAAAGAPPGRTHPGTNRVGGCTPERRAS
eukprot:5268393-Pyramimonas_sp.AAC.1